MRIRIALAGVILMATACSDDTSTTTGDTDQQAAGATSTAGAEATTTTQAPTTTRSTTTTTTTTTQPPITTQPFDFDPIEVSGVGDDVVDLAAPGDVPAILNIMYNGSSNFTIWSYNSSGDRVDLLVNTIGSYLGTRPVNLFEGDEIAFFEVGANGTWTLELRPLFDAPQIGPAGSITGCCDDVLIDAFASSSAARVTFTHDGDSNFQVWAHGQSRELLVNEIGDYSGTVLVSAGALVYDIVSEGFWSMRIDR